MKVKTLALAVAVLAVAAVAVWFFRPRENTPDTDPRVGKPLLDAAIVPKIVTLHIHSADKDITLVNNDPASAQWIVKEYHELPADFGKLSQFIQNLRDAKVIAFATSNPQRIAKMDFGDTKIELLDKDGKALWTADVGRSAENEIRFVKFGDEQKAYRATLSAWIDSTAKNWADAVIVPVKAEKVTGIDVDLPNNGGTLRFKRENAEAAWTADGLATGETVRGSDITSLVGKLAGLRFTETTEPNTPDAVAAKENARTFKLTTSDAKEYTITLGRRPAPPAPPPPPPPKPGPDGKTPPAPTPPPAPQPGPVYAFVKSATSTDPINGLMDRLGFQIAEWTFTGLPADRAALVQAAPPTPPPAPASTTATPPAASSDATTTTPPASAASGTPASPSDAKPTTPPAPAPAPAPAQ